VTEDLHSPTIAGPEPPTDTVPPDSSAATPLANLPVDVDEHPEILVGAAFAGGLVAALILKRLGR
jgi:hypothetical protein